MNVIPTSLKKALIFKLDVYADKSGFFMETYYRERYRKAGISQAFIQDNRLLCFPLLLPHQLPRR